MKVVINTCWGGFSLSKEAYEYLGLEWDGYGFAYNDKRTDPKLVKCVETLGETANGKYASLEVVEVPKNSNWYIDEYDGMESIKYNYKDFGDGDDY